MPLLGKINCGDDGLLRRVARGSIQPSLMILRCSSVKSLSYIIPGMGRPKGDTKDDVMLLGRVPGKVDDTTKP